MTPLAQRVRALVEESNGELNPFAVFRRLAEDQPGLDERDVRDAMLKLLYSGELILNWDRKLQVRTGVPA